MTLHTLFMNNTLSRYMGLMLFCLTTTNGFAERDRGHPVQQPGHVSQPHMQHQAPKPVYQPHPAYSPMIQHQQPAPAAHPHGLYIPQHPAAPHQITPRPIQQVAPQQPRPMQKIAPQHRPYQAPPYQSIPSTKTIAPHGGSIVHPGVTTHPGALPHHGIQPTIPITPHTGIQQHGKPYQGVINPAQQFTPGQVVKNTFPSHFSNPVTQQNILTSTNQHEAFLKNANNARWINQIKKAQTDYRNRHFRLAQNRFNQFGFFWLNPFYHDWYGPWYNWGFYGGFWYPVRPFFDIDTYFAYPMVQWFYADQPIAEDYYAAYYINEGSPPAACLQPFPYKHLYFSTDTVRDLLVEVSGLDQALRCNFQAAANLFTRRLLQAISANFQASFTLNDNDIVVNYYQNLQNQAIVIAGFVSHGDFNVAFEGLLDLADPNNTMVFAPNGQNPSDDQLEMLQQLNARIINLGGDPFTAQEEPAR